MVEGLRKRMFRSISSDFHSKWILDDFLTLHSPPRDVFRPSGSQGNAVRTDQYATCIMRAVAILLATLTPYQPNETVIIPPVKKVHIIVH